MGHVRDDLNKAKLHQDEAEAAVLGADEVTLELRVQRFGKADDEFGKALERAQEADDEGRGQCPRS